MNMKRKKHMSAREKLLKIAFIFLIPFFLFMLGYTVYSNQVLKSRLADTNLGRIASYQSFIEGDLKRVEYFMSDLIANDSAYNCLRYPLSNIDTYLQIYNITEKMDSVLKTIECVDVLCVTTLKSGMFGGSYSANCTSEDKEILKESINSLLEAKGDAAIGKWGLFDINGSNFFLKVMGGNEVYCICGVKASSISTKEEVSQGDEYILITKEDNPLFYDEDMEEKGIRFQEESSYLSGQDKYFIVQSYSDVLSGNFALVTPYRGIWNLESGSLIMVGAMLMFFVLLLICYRMLKKDFLAPMGKIVKTMETITEGDTQTRLEVYSKITEYEKLEQTFNHMIERIQELKILAYDRLIEKQQTELQYYQIQIRPHFFLNCLKNLYAMSVEQKYGQMQEMILSLSDYLRFVFREQEITIPLGREMDCVRSYVKLQQMSNSKPPVFGEEIDPTLMDFKIPPMSILTFVENAIRYSRITESEFHIRITARLLGDGEEQYVNLSITDNGCGFSEESLTILNQRQKRMPNEHVGIHNVKKRFSLVYEDACSFSFSNRDGACIDIFIPYKRVGEQEEGRQEA